MPKLSFLSFLLNAILSLKSIGWLPKAIGSWLGLAKPSALKTSVDHPERKFLAAENTHTLAKQKSRRNFFCRLQRIWRFQEYLH